MKNTIILSSIFILATFASCRKIIDVDVKASAPKYVIEGNITDGDAAATVRISKTVYLNASNDFPAVSGATVRIRDIYTGLEANLSEKEPGIYQSATLKGSPGHQYQLMVKIDGAVFSAQSTMPLPVTLDSVFIVNTIFGREVQGAYTDPAATKNYYHFTAHKNGKLQDGIFLANDEINNGQFAITSILIAKDTAFHPGDHIVATLECIDPAMFQYYFGLSIAADQSSATPANPKSNITGNALGYFSAHTVSSRELQVP